MVCVKKVMITPAVDDDDVCVCVEAKGMEGKRNEKGDYYER